LTSIPEASKIRGFFMLENRLLLTFVCGLISTGASALLAQTYDSTARFTENGMKMQGSILFKPEAKDLDSSSLKSTGEKYPWHTQIVTTIFWIGESPSGNNPVPNRSSAWDSNWARNFGGSDSPEPGGRKGFIPARFVPRQNPFYLALPFNDVSGGRTKAESYKVIPWFQETFQKSGQSVLKGRWVALRRGTQMCYAQWEDVGPFRSDHWEYVFGNARPSPNLNRGAGLDVSPAVRDYLMLGSNDLTDWRFVDFQEVPSGPWALYGDNNTFVIERRKHEEAFAKRE
jgi:hypothetical protein